MERNQSNIILVREVVVEAAEDVEEVEEEEIEVEIEVDMYQNSLMIMEENQITNKKDITTKMMELKEMLKEGSTNQKIEIKIKIKKVVVNTNVGQLGAV